MIQALVAIEKMCTEQSPKIKWVGNRILGCQSTNHTSCKGELWKCERCHKKICWEEGSTDLIDLCDDCWYDIRVSGNKK
jgi:hypothetical protein